MISVSQVIGEKGKTIIYSIPNVRIVDDSLMWDSFRFYTPVGTLVDSEGYHYFDVLGDELLIERDEALDREIVVFVTQQNGIEAAGFYEGELPSIPSFDSDGDIIINIFIPCNPENEIKIEVKEVIDD